MNKREKKKQKAKSKNSGNEGSSHQYFFIIIKHGVNFDPWIGTFDCQKVGNKMNFQKYLF